MSPEVGELCGLVLPVNGASTISGCAMSGMDVDALCPFMIGPEMASRDTWCK